MVLLLGQELRDSATEHLVDASGVSVGASVEVLDWLHSSAGHEGQSPGFLQFGLAHCAVGARVGQGQDPV